MSLIDISLHTHEDYLVHIQEEVYVLNGFKRLVVWFLRFIGHEED